MDKVDQPKDNKTKPENPSKRITKNWYEDYNFLDYMGIYRYIGIVFNFKKKI
ncbi:hypothetical protein UM538_05010 [Staphylococcus aureus]|nr:hypothetical protein UM538_05010 [Staphylococcus aureus]